MCPTLPSRSIGGRGRIHVHTEHVFGYDLPMPSQLRWSTVDDPTGQPALFDDVVERHVGKGEYRGLEFFHVESRRLINRISASAPLPFEYTINAYRGCSHACSYCLGGDTPILMADGSSRPLSEIRPGDRIIGTSGDGPARRYVTTVVQDHWQTVRAAHRIRLESGTEIVASADHRFLTDEGWRYVAGGRRGEVCRPHLASTSRLVGPGPAVDRTAGADPDLNGQIVKSDSRFRVESIEGLGTDLPMYDITTGTGDFVANGVISHNCFARPTHEYLGFDIGEDFDSKIVVKVNAVELARAETAPSRWAGHPIAMGTNTDPYQAAEGRYRLTRGIVEVLAERSNTFSILTKSSLVVRDLDLLAEAAARMRITVDFSIGTLDEEVWKLTEPGTPHPRRRIEALRRLSEAGVPSGILMAPILPGISDGIEQLEEVVAAGLDAGARFISPMYLHMRGSVRDHYMDWLNGARPDLVPRYEQGYRPNGNAPPKAAAWLSERVRELIDKHGGIRARRIERSEMAGRPEPERPRQLGFDL